jgi:hypothetical protein
MVVMEAFLVVEVVAVVVVLPEGEVVKVVMVAYG